jgi:hypothetical protein
LTAINFRLFLHSDEPRSRDSLVAPQPLERLSPGRRAPNKIGSRATWRCADGGVTARRTGDVKKLRGECDTAADRSGNDPMQCHGGFRQTTKGKGKQQGDVTVASGQLSRPSRGRA